MPLYCTKLHTKITVVIKGVKKTLDVIFYGKNIEIDGNPNIISQQGICSKSIQAIVKELEVQGVKKKLDLIEDEIFVDEKKIYVE